MADDLSCHVIMLPDQLIDNTVEHGPAEEQPAAGSKQLEAGLEQLVAGLEQLEAGMEQLAAVVVLSGCPSGQLYSTCGPGAPYAGSPEPFMRLP
jgi:X-X-X-Leu-X-X-Gly heptad repeat protein